MAPFFDGVDVIIESFSVPPFKFLGLAVAGIWHEEFGKLPFSYFRTRTLRVCDRIVDVEQTVLIKVWVKSKPQESPFVIAAEASSFKTLGRMSKKVSTEPLSR